MIPMDSYTVTTMLQLSKHLTPAHSTSHRLWW